mmetsp:Transcript_17462/g.34757  ORF Transcript_17462/g.34757 Transcript_17462/m.34757 type:complete len:305 (+) Transcript_17462:2285-3199(+)
MGVNLPEHALRTSCPTIPPRVAHMGERHALAPRATWRRRAALSPSCTSSGSRVAACARTSATAASSPGAGRAFPCWRRYAASARKPRWSSGGRSNLAKSLSIISPGAAVASWYVRKASCVGCFTCAMYPWVAGVYDDRSPISKVYGPVTLTTCSVSLSSGMPLTRLNRTTSPVSRPWRPWSSRTRTTPGLDASTDSTWEVAGFSPSRSVTVKDGPKSQKTEPKTPCANVLIKHAPFARQASLIAIRSASGSGIVTTTHDDPWIDPNSSLAASTSRISTYWFSSASFPRHAAARPTPPRTSAAVR